MKTNSIIYKSFVPTVLKPQKDTRSEPTFKYKGYQRQYRWDEDDTSQNTSQTQSEASEETTSTQPEFTQTVTSIQSPSITPGTTTYKDSTINVGNMKDLLDRFNQAGISVRVTSGLRPGATTSNGSKSWHSEGWAIDITPGEGETWESLRTKLKSSPDLIKYMQDNQLGILDETNPDMLARTGGTGAHWHIGRDRSAIFGLQAILSARHGTKLPIILAKSGTKNKSVVQQLLDTPLKSAVIGNQFQDLDPKVLKQYADIATDFIPVVGDAKELYNIGENIKNKRYIPALASTLGFILPGNMFKGSQKLLGLQLPINKNLVKQNELDYIFKGIDTDISRSNSYFSNRIKTGSPERTGISINGDVVGNDIQNYIPEIRETQLNGNRYKYQQGYYIDSNSNYPESIAIPDKNTTLLELSPNINPKEKDNQILDLAQRRIVLDHELQHYFDSHYNQNLKNSPIDFIYGNAPNYLKDPLEISAMIGQAKNYAKISDGLKQFDVNEFYNLLNNYRLARNTTDNNFTNFFKSISSWPSITKWANEKVQVISTPKLPKIPMLNENEDSE